MLLRDVPLSDKYLREIAATAVKSPTVHMYAYQMASV